MLPENKHRFLTMTALIGIMLVLLVGLPSQSAQAANCGGLPVSGGVIPAGTYTMTDNCNITATLEVNSGTVTINGGGFTISGGGTMRVLEVSGGATLNLDNVTVADGAPLVGGGISSDTGGTLTVTNTTFSNNGSGIGSSFSVVTVIDSIFTNNGSGISSLEGTLEVSNSTFSDNSASGIVILSGIVTITNSTFSNNSSTPFGGAISSVGSPFLGPTTLTVTNSSFSNNSASERGGGIGGGGTLTVINSSFAGNSAGNSGSAIDFGGTLTITNSTFSRNGPSSAIFVYGEGSVAVISFSCIENNISSIDVFLVDGTLTAENNWWGVPTGPNTPGADTTNVPVSSWLSSPDDPSCLPTDTMTPTQSLLNQLLDIAGVTAYDLPDGYYGRLLMRDGAWQANPGTIPQELIDNGVILAVDVFQLSGQQNDNDFGGHVPICLEGSGRLIFLDATTSPRLMIELETFTADDMTCGWVPNAGTLVLIQGR